MDQKKRWPQIDILYTLGIVLVLIGHSHSSDWSTFEGTILHKAILFIYTFHMPLFFFVAGFLFQNSDRLERQGYGKWVGEKALRLLVPYLFWTLLALVPKYYLEHHGFSGLTPMYVLRVIFVPRENIWGHFWFVPVLLLTYVLFGGIRLATNRWNQVVIALTVVAVTTGVYFIPVKINVFGLADLKSDLVFFALGILLRVVYPEKGITKKKPAAFAVGVAVFFLALGAIFLWRFDSASTLSSHIIALLILAACWLLAELLPSGKAITWFSEHNFTIYIFSWFFQAAMMLVCDKLRVLWVVTFVCMFFIGLVGPILLSIILDRLPYRKNRWFRLVFGMR